VVADGLDEGAEAEVAGAPEVSLGGAHDEDERVWAERRVRHCDGVELGTDEVGHVVGREPGDEDGVGHAALDVVVRGQGERGQKTWLRDEDEVVVLGKILEEQAEAAQVARGSQRGGQAHVHRGR
jgi:hypothetical protein